MIVVGDGVHHRVAEARDEAIAACHPHGERYCLHRQPFLDRPVQS
jgi:hypothetical protein